MIIWSKYLNPKLLYNQFNDLVNDLDLFMKKYIDVNDDNCIVFISTFVDMYNRYLQLCSIYDILHINNSLIDDLLIDDILIRYKSVLDKYNCSAIFKSLTDKNIPSIYCNFVRMYMYVLKNDYVIINNDLNSSLNHDKIYEIISYINKFDQYMRFNINHSSFKANIKNQLLSDNMKQKIDNSTFIIDHSNYRYINNNIICNKERYRIQSLYYKSNNKFMNSFAKSIILKHKFAIKCNFDTFGHYFLNDDFDKIQTTLRTTINELTIYINNIHKHISNDLKVNYISDADIKFWFNQNIWNKMTSVNNVVLFFIGMAKKYFDLDISFSDVQYSLWRKNILTLIVKRKNKSLGVIHLDFFNKNVSYPKTIIINNSHKDYDDQIVIAIIANYPNIDSNIIDIFDANFLFEQMGFALHHIIYDSSIGLHNSNPQHQKFFIYIIYCIFVFNFKYISKYIYYEIICNIYNLSTDAIFYILIHTSKFFVDSCKTLINDEDNIANNFNKIYHKISKVFFNKFIYLKASNNIMRPDLLSKLIHNTPLFYDSINFVAAVNIILSEENNINLFDIFSNHTFCVSDYINKNNSLLNLCNIISNMPST